MFISRGHIVNESMGEMKRKLSFNHSMQEKIKKFRSKLSINCIENLSNELFYEIFDYLDGIHIYQALSNLNHHFQQLLNSSFLLFKITYSSLGEAFLTNGNQIYNFVV
jgi:hypothetical protein